MLLTFSISMTCIGILFKIDLLVPLFLLRKTARSRSLLRTLQAAHAEKIIVSSLLPTY